MKLAGLISVGACWCVLFSGIAASSILKPQPGPVLVGSSIDNDEITPVTLNLTLYKDGEYVKSCSGAYIQKDVISKVYWILPAECVDETEVNRTSVAYGGKQVLDRTRSFYELSSLKYNIHPNYDRNTKAHNIAVVTLRSRTCNFRPDYKTIQLPNTNDTFDKVKTLGLYEYTTAIKQPDNKKGEATLLSVKPRLMYSFWCKILYPFSPIKHNVCASGFFNKGLSENGLGTPLIAWDGENFKLVGLATVVRPWTHKFSLPMEFLSVLPYMDWINSIIHSK